jgi:hypothetical protein
MLRLSPMRCATILLLATSTACAPVASQMADTKPQEGTAYFWADLSRGRGRAVERLAAPGSITARHGLSGRRTIYTISDGGVAAVPRFGFQQLEKATLEVELRRVSDLGGQGIDKGQVRRTETFRRELSGGDLYAGFQLLQALSGDPFQTAKKEAPEAWAKVAEPTQVDGQEVGFRIDATATLLTGNPFDASARVVLFRLDSSSPYQRAQDAGSSGG